MSNPTTPASLPARLEPIDWDAATNKLVLNRFPHLVAHMICESLGYFTPEAAAQAIIRHKRGAANYCEWYYDNATFLRTHNHKFKDVDMPTTLIHVGKSVIQSAIRLRRQNTSGMRNYSQARAAVGSSLGGHGPQLASWF